MVFSQVFMLYATAAVLLCTALFLWQGYKRHRQVFAAWLIFAFILNAMYRTSMAFEMDHFSANMIAIVGPCMAWVAGLIYWLQPRHICKDRDESSQKKD